MTEVTEHTHTHTYSNRTHNGFMLSIHFRRYLNKKLKVILQCKLGAKDMQSENTQLGSGQYFDSAL